MDDLSAPTGREPELAAVPRADGTRPGRRRLRRHRLHRRPPRAAPARRRLPRARARARSRRASAPSRGATSVEVVAGDAADAGCRRPRPSTDVDVLYYLVHSMSAGKGFEDADRARGRDRRAGGGRGIRRSHRLPRRACIPTTSTLSPHLRSRVEVGEIFLRVRRADARAAGRRRDRVGLGVVRDGAAPHRRAAVHAGAEVGAQPHPADRRARRAALPARRGARRAGREPRRRHRRTRRAALRPDDERLRGRGRAAAAADRRAAGAHAAARLALGEPRHARSRARSPGRSSSRCRTSAS